MRVVGVVIVGSVLVGIVVGTVVSEVDGDVPIALISCIVMVACGCRVHNSAVTRLVRVVVSISPRVRCRSDDGGFGLFDDLMFDGFGLFDDRGIRDGSGLEDGRGSEG